MTQTCAPADQTVSGWHWVEKDGKPYAAEWCFPGWWSISSIGPGVDRAALHALGYRYVRPCPTPEQIAERERMVRTLVERFVADWSERFDMTWWAERGFLTEPTEATWGLTPLGRAVMDLAKEPQS